MTSVRVLTVETMPQACQVDGCTTEHEALVLKPRCCMGGVDAIWDPNSRTIEIACHGCGHFVCRVAVASAGKANP